MQQQLEDAAQAPLDRKLSNYRTEIPDLRNQGNSLSTPCPDGGRASSPAVTRPLQCAADIASSRNDQQMSAKSLQRRWKNEIQIALLHRRAAVTRAVLPNPSARAERLLAGIIDGAFHHWGRVPLLTVELETTTTQTPGLTQPYQMMTMTSPPSPVNRQHLCSHQACSCPPLPCSFDVSR